MNFPPGKVPNEILQKIIFRNLGKKRNDVILGPSIGEDTAIVKAGKELLAVSVDPITGAEKWLGWLAVNVSANDIATRGIKPRWFTSCILLPEASKEGLIEEICSQIDSATSRLNIAVISGHCEITPGLTRPMITGCSIGIVENDNYVTSSNAKPENKLILTKGAGIEGTAILASDRRNELLKVFNEKFVKKAEDFFLKISVVKDALTAFKKGGILAMHDPTEGGVAGGLHELADAADIGLQVNEEKIFVSEVTKRICAYFDIDPIQLISSGSLLIVVKKEKTMEVINELSQEGIYASVIGETKESDFGRKMITKKGYEIDLVRPISDHLWTALAKTF